MVATAAAAEHVIFETESLDALKNQIRTLPFTQETFALVIDKTKSDRNRPALRRAALLTLERPSADPAIYGASPKDGSRGWLYRVNGLPGGNSYLSLITYVDPDLYQGIATR